MVSFRIHKQSVTSACFPTTLMALSKSKWRRGGRRKKNIWGAVNCQPQLSLSLSVKGQSYSLVKVPFRSKEQRPGCKYVLRFKRAGDLTVVK